MNTRREEFFSPEGRKIKKVERLLRLLFKSDVILFVKRIGILGVVIFVMINLSCKKDFKITENTLERAVTWLWSQQSEEGGWYSTTHAVLRDGKVLTPYILFHLLQLPQDILRDKEKEIQNAYAFIVREMNASLDEKKSNLTDYPNYSAAYTLRVMNILQGDTSLQNILIDYLLDQQFTEQRGFDSTHLAYGGWGYGEAGLPYGRHGHVDISHTRRVTEALCEAGYLRHNDLQERIGSDVEFFIEGVQRHPDDRRLYEGCKSRKDLPYDGGFIASVVTLSTIKSQPVEFAGAGIHYPSYATATCDGLMTMRMLGLQKTKAYTDTKKWLKENQHYSTIDGLKDHPEQWDEIMHYYHLAVRSEAMNVADPYGAWRDSIEMILEKEIHPDGSYVNPLGGVNKEDDPLMATIFAIQALSNIRNHRDVVSSTDIKIIDAFVDTTMNPSPFSGLHKTKIIIQNLTKDTLFFAGSDSTQLRVAVTATYTLPQESLRHSHAGCFFGQQPYDVSVYPLQTVTLIYYHELMRPHSRMDIQLDYVINQQQKSVWAIVYN